MYYIYVCGDESTWGASHVLSELYDDWLVDAIELVSNRYWEEMKKLNVELEVVNDYEVWNGGWLYTKDGSRYVGGYCKVDKDSPKSVRDLCDTFEDFIYDYLEKAEEQTEDELTGKLIRVTHTKLKDEEYCDET